LPLTINPLAEGDLAEAKAWYDEKRIGLGGEFVLCVEEVFERVRRTPELYSTVFEDLRLAPVRRFPYLVVYRADQEEIAVVAVYHAHRDPRGWQERA
jgi:plasmid stabilization system protein ParE